MRYGRPILLGSILWLASLAGNCLGDTLFQDDFQTPRGRYEYYGERPWTVGTAQCHFAATDSESYAVVNLPEQNEMRIELSVQPDRRTAPGYATAGLTLFLDPENHWRLLLVSGPGDKPYIELVERHRGVHQAQYAPPHAKSHLVGKHEGDLQDWKYGHAYRLVLSISPEAIVGEVRDPDTSEFWRQTYRFAHARAVRRGRPGLTACGLEGNMRQFLVDGPRAAATSSLAIHTGKAGNLAIVDDQSQRIAGGLEAILSKAGYGITRVTWSDLEKGPLPARDLDLVLLADARRLPASAVAMTMNHLRSGGKLIALGAPAFGELLLKTPRGYVSKENYAKALYDSLARRTLNITSAGWRKNTSDATRPGEIQSEGQAWKATVDLDGWYMFVHPLADAFRNGHSLLAFRARGDRDTPQLAVECTEKDSSRWIATVELGTDWREVVLRPADFRFWPDSPIRRDDRLEPANIVSMQIGLSRSHTPQCLPGKHTFWVADLATAADPEAEQADVIAPEIEALSPSYMLYPVDGPVTARPGSQVPWLTTNGKLDFTGYASMPREPGIGFDRHRTQRWIRLLDAHDSTGHNRGAIAWMMLGETRFPGAIWASLGLADPESLLAKGPAANLLQPALLDLVQTVTRGTFLLEGGSRFFSYPAGDPIELGALVGNSGRSDQSLTVSFQLNSARGEVLFQKSVPIAVAASERQETTCTFTPTGQPHDQFPYTVTVELRAGDQLIDRLTHRIDRLESRKAAPDEFVRVEGSQFKLRGKPWYMLGVNYWPNSQGGRPTVPYLQRQYYNPELIEQDLATMEAAGVNMLSGIQFPEFKPEKPGVYRDLQDFLQRCDRHGMKLFVFLPWANPLATADLKAIQQHIDAAGIKDHPAILSWELSWEPIYYSGPASGQMDSLLGDWNAWIADHYDSLDEAERDWGYKLPRSAAHPNQAAMPDHRWCAEHGPWDRLIAAFRQFFSDRVGHAYGDLIRQLRRYDPNHLITFRFGACGIPESFRFAHSHSASVAKHVDFLCPEGYNLQTRGVNKNNPADDLRKGGLVTLYYRFLSREKPVVWMEFGYTVNGMHAVWKTSDVRVLPSELDNQRTEFENFYHMFLESGARGAAPWWYPSGFRIGEESDFGLVEPDGTGRPAWELLKKSLPKFAHVPRTSCVASSQDDSPTITLDLDAHYPDGWKLYSAQYLDAVKSGHLPFLRTDGTGTTSANCPMLAVGNTPLTGHNPPKYLNAEFNSVELKLSDAPWRETRRGQEITIRPTDVLRCRASVGNIAEAAWNASDKPGHPGIVYLACRLEPSAKSLHLPLAAATPYLADGQIREFTVPVSAGDQKLILQMCVTRIRPDGTTLIIPFGERRVLKLKLLP